MTLKQALQSDDVLIADGGFGTELQKLGLGSALGDEWNLTHPEQVLSLHQRYRDAGSKLITTNTFGANRSTLAKHGLAEKQVEINRAGAVLAKQAVAGEGWVLGDVGPNGDMLKPLGKATVPDLEASLRVQIGALLDAGVDAILIETMTALQEVQLAIRVARQMGAPCVIATCAFDPFPVGPRTNMGVTPQQFAKVAAEEGADAIGANCGKVLQLADFLPLIEGFRSATNLPLLIQPNAGKPVLEDGKFIYKMAAAEAAELMMQLAQRAKIVGGCCGTTPDHIRAFRDRLQTGRATHA